MEYEDVREKILSLACEEVGNIMFSTDEKITWQEHEMPDFCGTGDDAEAAYDADGALYGNEEAACEDDASDGEAYDDDEEVSVDADQLNAVSKAAVALLQNRKKPGGRACGGVPSILQEDAAGALRIPHGRGSKRAGTGAGAA